MYPGRMKLRLLIITILAAAAGWFAARHSMPPQDAAGMMADHATSQQCPMHPWVRSGQPGKCNICGMDLVAGSAAPSAANVVMLPPGSAQVLGVQTAEVKQQPLVRTLRVAGKIEEDASRHGVISAPVEGRLDGLWMNHSGQQVARRQPLATIFSRTLLKEADDYKQSLALGGPALAEARKRLEQHGLIEEQIQSIPNRQPDDLYFGVLSPRTGVIVKSYVSEGQYVKEGQKLFEVADFTTLWFMFTAYEQDLPLLKPKQEVRVRIATQPGQVIRARISNISPILDDTMHSAMVRVVIENPDRKILNNASATAEVVLDAPVVLSVPRTAVLWTNTTPRVYVQQAAGAYQQRAIKLGLMGDSLVEVLEGLREGERIVTQGSALIDSQAQLDAMAAPENTVAAGASEEIAPSLMSYLQSAAAVNAALANDDLAACNAALKQLPPAPEIFKTAPPQASADLLNLRKAFLPWSQELAAQGLQLKAKVPGLHVFRCPMTNDLWPGAPKNAAWIQFSSTLQNPYWGEKMRECGVEVLK
jgi:membrane fusion protein, copper/silver efflux system